VKVIDSMMTLTIEYFFQTFCLPLLLSKSEKKIPSQTC